MLSPRLRTAVLVLGAALLLPGTAFASNAAPSTARSASADIPSDTQISFDDFESGFGGWTPITGGNGTVTNPSVTGHGGSATKAAQMIVPNYTTSSLAYLKKTLADPVYAISAVGWFKELSGGCDDSAGYSNGSVPFFRFFDTTGRRVAGLARENGSCSKTSKLYVEHSGSFFRTNKNLAFATWYKLELRITVAAGSSRTEVYINDALQYSAAANNGITPIKVVTMHNEHSNQVGDLIADDVRIATFDSTPPTNPCDPAFPAPTTSDPGTVVLADNFEAGNLNKWTATGLSGDASANVVTSAAKTGNCGALLHVTSSTASRAYLNKVLPAGTSEVWASGSFNVKAEGGSGSNVPSWRLFSGSNRIVDVFRTNVTGAMFIRTPNGSGGYVYTSLGRSFALNTWYDVKVHAIASSGTVEVWLNGQAVYTKTALPLGTSTLSSAQVNAEHFAQVGDLAVDDVVIKRVP